MAATALALTGCTPLINSGGASAADDDFSIESSLAQVPAMAAGDAPVIYAGDIAAAAEAAGLARPEDPEAWLSELLGPLSGTDNDALLFVPFGAEQGMVTVAGATEFADDIGVSPADIDQFVEVIAAPKRFSVYWGPFDDTTLSDDLEDLGNGIRSAGSGEDFETDFEGLTPARPMGVPLRLAHEGSRVAMSPETGAVRAWLDGATTLADDAALSGVARALDDSGAITAMLTSQENWPSSTHIDSSLLPSDPFTAVGIGWSVVDDESRVFIAYAFDSETAADAAVPVFERQWTEGAGMTGQSLSDYFTFESADTSDAVATVTLVPVAPVRTAADMMMRQDLPFMHG